MNCYQLILVEKLIPVYRIDKEDFTDVLFVELLFYPISTALAIINTIKRIQASVINCSFDVGIMNFPRRK